MLTSRLNHTEVDSLTHIEVRARTREYADLARGSRRTHTYLDACAGARHCADLVYVSYKDSLTHM